MTSAGSFEKKSAVPISRLKASLLSRILMEGMPPFFKKYSALSGTVLGVCRPIRSSPQNGVLEAVAFFPPAPTSTSSSLRAAFRPNFRMEVDLPAPDFPGKTSAPPSAEIPAACSSAAFSPSARNVVNILSHESKEYLLKETSSAVGPFPRGVSDLKSLRDMLMPPFSSGRPGGLRRAR